MRPSSANFLIHHWEKNGFSLQLCSRLHAFKYEFSRICWEWAHRAPSPDSSHNSILDFILESGFALNSQALRAVGSGFALNSPPNYFPQRKGTRSNTVCPPASTFWQAPLPRLIRAQFWQIYGSATENLKDKLSLQLYTRLHGFKYKFSKIFWGGAYRAPSPDPSPF